MEVTAWWKESHPSLPSNFSVCSRSMVHWLSRTPGLVWHHHCRSREEGFIKQVDKSDHASTTHYIRYHPVRKESTTTPITIMYNCNCKQSRSSPNLNDCLQAGPLFHNDLSGILLRFQQHDLAFSVDIEEAFLHVSLIKTDWNFTQFLWLSEPDNANSPFIIYRFKVVLRALHLCLTLPSHFT